MPIEDCRDSTNDLLLLVMMTLHQMMISKMIFLHKCRLSSSVDALLETFPFSEKNQENSSGVHRGTFHRFPIGNKENLNLHPMLLTLKLNELLQENTDLDLFPKTKPPHLEQPFLLCLGSFNDPKHYYLIVDECAIPCGSECENAFQILIASFFTFGMEYPLFISQWYQFFEEAVFNIRETSCNNVASFTATLESLPQWPTIIHSTIITIHHISLFDSNIEYYARVSLECAFTSCVIPHFLILIIFSICCYYLIDSFPHVTLVELKCVGISQVDWYFVPTGSNDRSSSHFSVVNSKVMKLFVAFLS